MPTIRSKSSAATKDLAKKIARKLKGGDVLALTGELGGGKTTFVQGLAKGLGITKNITSPSFLILKKYKVAGAGFKEFYHIDAYRLENSRYLASLGTEEIIADKNSVVAIEWADKVKKLLPTNAIHISFSYFKGNSRQILIKSPGRAII